MRPGGLVKVRGDADAAPVELQQLHRLVGLVCAQDQAEGRLLAGLLFVFLQPAQVQLHLALVRCLELADLQVNDDEPAESAVVEEQVDIEVVSVDDNPFLAVDEGETAAQLQNEALDLAQDGGFQVLFAVGVGQAEEVEEVGIAEDQVGSQDVLLAQGLQFLLGQLRRFPGQGGALEEHAADLLPQRADAPAFHAAHLGVKVALQVGGLVDDLNEVAPAQLS